MNTTDRNVAAALSELQDFIELRAQYHTAEFRRGAAGPRALRQPQKRKISGALYGQDLARIYRPSAALQAEHYASQTTCYWMSDPAAAPFAHYELSAQAHPRNPAAGSLAYQLFGVRL